MINIDQLDCFAKEAIRSDSVVKPNQMMAKNGLDGKCLLFFSRFVLVCSGNISSYNFDWTSP